MANGRPYGLLPSRNLSDLASASTARANLGLGIAPASLYVTASGSDATGTRGRSDLPFATLNAAASAAQSGDTIYVGPGTFAPLQVAPPSWVQIVGAGVPHVDNPAAPTQLVGGTVIKGPVGYKTSDGTLLVPDGFGLENLGVDSGSAACTALYSGAAQDAIAISNVPSSHTSGISPLKGIRLRNVVALAQSATAAVHAIRLENLDRPVATDLSSWYGTHGIAIKATGGLFRGLSSRGHATDGLIVKANGYAPCAKNSISGVYLGCVSAGDSGGLRLQAENEDPAHISSVVLSDVSVSGLVVDGTTFSIATTTGSGDGSQVTRCHVPAMVDQSAGGLSLSGNFDTLYLDTAWTVPTLLNSWANLGGGNSTAGYRMAAGVVHLRGTVLGGTTGTTIFQLPAGFRPPSGIARAAGIQGGASVADVSIDSSGNVAVEATAGTSWVPLDGISFAV